MTDFSPTKFIHKDVKLQYRNFDNNWHVVTVIKVYGYNHNIFLGKFVYCDIKFDNGEVYNHFIFTDKEYESNSDNAWKFAHPWCVSINEIKELNNKLYTSLDYYNCTNSSAYLRTHTDIPSIYKDMLEELWEEDEDDEDEEEDEEDEEDEDYECEEEDEDEDFLLRPKVHDEEHDNIESVQSDIVTIIYPGFWSTVIISSIVSTIATTMIIYASHTACSVY